MKRLIVLAGLLAAAAGAAGIEPFDASVQRRILTAHKGKVLLLNFWATWCAPCLEEMPTLVGLEAKYRARGFRLLTVSADDPEQLADAQRILARNKVPPPAYIKRTASDEQFINAVDPEWSGALPSLFLYDRQGNKAASFVGEASMAELEAAIRKLL